MNVLTVSILLQYPIPVDIRIQKSRTSDEPVQATIVMAMGIIRV